MSTFAPAYVTLNPSMMLPDIAMQYSMVTGAFDLLPSSRPEVKIGTNDLLVYQKTLRLTTQNSVSQSLPNQLMSSSVIPDYTQMMTYRIATRSQYGLYDDTAASQWGYALPAALQLAARQGTAQTLRVMLLYGMQPSNGEGIVNAPGAMTVNLGADSHGETAYTRWDNGELAQALLGHIAALKIRMLMLGQPARIVVCGPQRFLSQLSYTGIVQLTSYQRPGAGTATAGVVVQTIAGEAVGDDVIFTVDETLLEKGAGGADLIIISAPVLNVPSNDASINTNIFASLTPNQRAVNQMFCDVAAPTEITTPIADGALTTLYTMRSTPGWTLRSEGVTLLSAVYG
jgi:hypothetical protein